MQDKRKCKLLQIALNGWHGEGDRSRVSFYTTHLDDCLDYALESCTILDKSMVAESDLIHNVISGPMVDVSLPPNTVDRFSTKDKQTASKMLPGLGGAYSVLAKAAIEETPEKYGSLDRLSLDLYVDFWRKLGAKVGTYTNGKVQWE